jgi:hypothetical protein
MRIQVLKGEDPVQVKRQERAKGTTFAEACEGWVNKHKVKWRSTRHTKVPLGKHAKPLAEKPVRMISTPMIVDALSDLWKRHPEQARRVLSMWAQERVMRYYVFIPLPTEIWRWA